MGNREDKLGKIAVHGLLWICFSMFSIAVATIEIGEVPKEMLVRLIFNPILFYVNSSFLVPFFLLNKKVVLYIFWSILFLIAFNYILINFFNGSFFNFLGDSLRSKNTLPKFSNIRYIAPTVFSLSFFLLGGIYGLANDFYKKDRLEKIRLREQKEIELQFLRTQLKPHFLFNTLNSIYFLVSSKSEDAPEAVIMLSELMRYMLYEVGKNKVSLEKEINYIKNYISLQKLRLNNSEQVKLKIKGDYKHLQIYPLLLISFIENAFKHGTDFKGLTFIDIAIDVSGHELSFKVKNIIGIEKKGLDGSGIGLSNIKSQLDFLYKDNYNLLAEIQDGYYIVDLKINLL